MLNIPRKNHLQYLPQGLKNYIFNGFPSYSYKKNKLYFHIINGKNIIIISSS